MIRTPSQKALPTSFGEICYFEWGVPASSGNSSNSVLLLHATGFHARCWDKIVDMLPQTAHVIAVDQLGHGRSAKPDSLSNWRKITGATLELLGHLNLQFAVAVGHSMGGQCLSQIAGQLPEIFDQLILIDPVIMEPELYDNDLRVEDMEPALHPMSKRRANWDSPQQLFDRLKDHPSYTIWHPDILMDYCQHGLLPTENDAGYKLACDPKLEGSVYMGALCNDPYPALAKIACPVMVMRAPRTNKTATVDFTMSPTWPDLADRFDDGEDMFCPELTHFIPMQAPDLVARKIAEFLPV